MSNKANIKLNKKHGGKEFSNKFQFVGKISPVQRKDDASDSWYDVEVYDDTVTRTGRDRKVIQFLLETAPFNRLKIELAGMEMERAYLYSMKERKSFPIDWENRFDKSLYPNDTYFLIDTDWDKTVKFGKFLKNEMWVDVKGHYEFDSFITDDGNEIKLVKRIIDNVTPLKNGAVEITGLKAEETVLVHDSQEEGNFLGQGKASAEGVASIRVGWLNPEGGELYVSKSEGEGKESSRTKVPYNENELKTGQFTVTNNLKVSPVRVNGQGRSYEYVDYVQDFRDENFKEINSFEMQLGIRSTYQDEETLDTTVNGVYLDYGRDKSTPKDVELTVFHKETEEGATSLATAFGRLNYLDFMVVEGIDNNRAETTLVEVEETEEDNPFEDVGEKTISYKEVSSGTKKGLEITSYVTGTYVKELLLEEEILEEVAENPFEKVEIEEDDLPF